MLTLTYLVTMVAIGAVGMVVLLLLMLLLVLVVRPQMMAAAKTKGRVPTPGRPMRLLMRLTGTLARWALSLRVI